MVTKIEKPKKFNELAFSISNVNTALAILKTMIFVNSFNKKIILIIYLQNLLLAYMKNNGENLIKIFILILKMDIKTKYLKKICNSNTKIWICIDIIEMRVDIKNII